MHNTIKSKVNTPIWIQEKLLAALSTLTCVRHIAAFGATAEGRHDQYSDLDFIVACSHSEITPCRCASLIRENLPVLFYRPFTARPQPCGRYWFQNATPFNRLDISFESEAAYTEIRATGSKDAYPVVLRELYAAPDDACLEQDKHIAAPWQPIEISDKETELGRLLYRTLESLKHAQRGNPTWKWDRTTCINELRTALATSSQQHFNGGDLRALAEKCFALNDAAELTL